MRDNDALITPARCDLIDLDSITSPIYIRNIVGSLLNILIDFSVSR